MDRLYHQITTRFNFFPFNGIRHYSVRERRREALINGIIMVIPVLLTLLHYPLGKGIGASIWPLVLAI